MVTQKGDNTDVVAFHGNFDDAQSGVKAIFGDREFAKEVEAMGYQFSSANSINIGRLVPQIVYYVYAYAKLLENGEIQEGEQINVTVPTGNFGNILAAYFAKQMGLPIDKLICASNDNKVLYDFFKTGVYDRRREFILTNSPSMDILISSNLERLIYLSTGCDGEKTGRLMKDLAEKGMYEITGDTKKTVIASTASPYKFSRSVVEAIEGPGSSEDEFTYIDRLNAISGVALPQAVEEIKSAPVRHHMECEKDGMKETVRGILSGK